MEDKKISDLSQTELKVFEKKIVLNRKILMLKCYLETKGFFVLESFISKKGNLISKVMIEPNSQLIKELDQLNLIKIS